MINAVRGLELRDSTKELILSRNALEFWDWKGFEVDQ